MSRVGMVCGQALYTLAKEEKITDAVFCQFQFLRQCFDEEPEYLQLLSCVALSKPERCRLLDESVGTVLHPYLLNFLKILAENGRIRHFSECYDSYRQCYCRDKRILPVSAVTALPLSPAQAQHLSEKLATITKKTILLSNKVDAGVVGGMRLEYDGKQLEDTISHRMESVRRLLKNTVL